MSRTLLGFILLAVAVVVAVGVTLADTGSSPSQHGRVDVVAAENFYGDIVSQIGGSHVAVSSILSDPNADPHLFEPGTRNGLAVARAALVIQNGVGYDSFMQKLEDAAPSSHRTVVTIADVLGVNGADANPHLWYDVPALGRIASAIASGLSRADPAHRSDYRAGLVRFNRSLAGLRSEVAAIWARFGGTPVAYTEPVPGYLLAAAGLRSLTPVAFARAIEDGSEPSPEAVAQMTALFTGRRVRVLLYNDQTVSPITSRIRTAARTAGIPVVGVSETMPHGESFQQWQLGQARALESALRR
ncbi:MAG: metal ABC transporter solute-binding protein, Zn/Mn family [Jatrophihabitantaceae bacterium]